MYVVSLLARSAVFAMLIYVFGAISGNAAVLDITSFNRSEHAAARQALSAFQKGTDLEPGKGHNIAEYLQFVCDAVKKE